MKYYNLNIPLGVPILGTPFKCNPVLAALVGAGVSGAMGLFGQRQQSQYTKEQQRLQSRLNREEMAESYGLNRAQQEWTQQTMYGKAVSGMKNAGLNPAMAGGGSVGGVSGGSSGSLHTGASGPAAGGLNADPMAGASHAVDISQAQQRLDNETKVANAQADALSAQAEKSRGEKAILDLDKQTYMDKWNTNKAKLEAEKDSYNSMSKLYGQQFKTEEQKTKIAQQQVKNEEKQYEVLEATIKQLHASADQLSEDAKLKKIQRIWHSKEVQALIDHYKTMDQTSIFNAIVGLYTAESQAQVNEAVARLQNVQAQLAEDYGDMDAITKMGTSLISTIGGMFFGAKFSGKFSAAMARISKADKIVISHGKKK